MVQMVVADGVEFVVGADQFCRGQLGAHTVEGSGELGIDAGGALSLIHISEPTRPH